jgi:DNA-binding PucR family transcriptional regulator
MTEDNGDFVRITNRMVWDKLVDVEKKVDALNGVKDRVDKLETRANGLFTGVGAGAVAAVIWFFRSHTGG